MTVADLDFRKGTQAEFYQLAERQDNALYFVEDAGKIYKGNFDVTKNFQVSEDYDNLTLQNTLQNTFYLDPVTLRIKVRYKFGGVDHLDEYFPGVLSNFSENSPSASSSLITKGYLDSRLLSVINNLEQMIAESGQEVVVLSEVSSDNKVVVTNSSGLGDSGYSIGNGEIVEDSSHASDKVLATEKAAKKAAEDAADEATSKWGTF